MQGYPWLCNEFEAKPELHETVSKAQKFSKERKREEARESELKNSALCPLLLLPLQKYNNVSTMKLNFAYLDKKTGNVISFLNNSAFNGVF